MLLDLDEDVIAHARKSDAAARRMNSSRAPFESREYDVCTPVPTDLVGSFAVVVADAPWYQPVWGEFLAVATALLAHRGTLITTFPGLLTRPDSELERQKLIDSLRQSGLQLISLESRAVKYVVPTFEARAFEDLSGFQGRPWRAADIAILRKTETPDVVRNSNAIPSAIQTFAQKPAEFRVFLDKTKSSKSLSALFEEVADFSTNVSARAFQANEVTAWTTNKKGVRVSNSELLEVILRGWASEQSIDQITRDVGAILQSEADAARSVVNEAFSALGLSAAVESPRRSPELMRNAAKSGLSKWACEASPRVIPEGEDGFRLQFQRDRDRVFWSSGLRMLAHKTQVFPLESHDHVRQRLAHTIEVMQLASTIGASIGLDRDLIEAGAFVHDIGHAPFGHAGEHALNSVLDSIDRNLGGFSHYEHGMDVVRWLEDTYSSPAAGGFRGLNLSIEVVECIIKHTFKRRESRIGQAELCLTTKHTDIIKDDYCHLEGQAVRAADKISYLISDIEDGLRMEVFSIEDLLKCRLFDRVPIDFHGARESSAFEVFTSQRRAILQVLMEDLIEETSKRLSLLSNLDEVRRSTDYTVSHSRDVHADVTEIWYTLQDGKLHKDPRVVASNLRAATIVSQLTLLFGIAPELVDDEFQRCHAGLADSDYMNWYAKRAGETCTVPRVFLNRLPVEHSIGITQRTSGNDFRIPLQSVIQAKDFVASLSDERARSLFRRFFGTYER